MVRKDKKNILDDKEIKNYIGLFIVVFLVIIFIF